MRKTPVLNIILQKVLFSIQMDWVIYLNARQKRPTVLYACICASFGSIPRPSLVFWYSADEEGSTAPRERSSFVGWMALLISACRVGAYMPTFHRSKDIKYEDMYINSLTCAFDPMMKAEVVITCTASDGRMVHLECCHGWVESGRLNIFVMLILIKMGFSGKFFFVRYERLFKSRAGGKGSVTTALW